MTEEKPKKISSKREYVEISNEDKLVVLKLVDAGVRYKVICAIYNICKSTISKMLKRRETIRKLANGIYHGKRSRKVSKKKQVNYSVAKFVEKCIKFNVPIDDKMINYYARHVARKLGYKSVGGTHWLLDFKSKYRIRIDDQEVYKDLSAS